MNRGLRRQVGGFTIVETIIVLTVMVALLGSALLLFQQRVPKTQFTKSLNELTTQIIDISNQVANGYYPNTNNRKCEVDGSDNLKIESSTSEQGENEDCIFLGQAIKFGSSGCFASSECDKLRVYTVFGKRLNGGTVVNSLSDSEATVSPDFGVQDYVNGYGLSIQKIKNNDNALSPEYAGVVYLQSFGSSLAGGPDSDGAQQVMLASVPGSVNAAYGPFESAPFSGLGASVSEILLCVKSGTTDQYAFIVLGSNGNAMSVEQHIVDKTTWEGKQCPA